MIKKIVVTEKLTKLERLVVSDVGNNGSSAGDRGMGRNSEGSNGSNSGGFSGKRDVIDTSNVDIISRSSSEGLHGSRDGSGNSANFSLTAWSWHPSEQQESR
jgi:hypothetical protein